MKHLKLFDGFLNEKVFSSAEREKLADKGFALPDGSYPISNVEDLKNAVSAFGRSNPEKRKAVAQHIVKRAKALGKEDLIPQTEIFQKALQESALNEASSGAPEPLKLKDIKINNKNHLTYNLEIGYFIGDELVMSYLTTGSQKEAQELKNKVEKAFKDGKIISPSGIGYYAFNEAELNEGVVSIKGGRILAHKVLNKLVDMEVIPVKKKTEDLVEAIASLLASASLNEAIDVKYWTDYNTDTSGQSDPEFAIKSKDFEATFKEAVKDWNDRGEDPITMGEAEKVKKIAKEFFNKAGWISVNVAHAMIAQES